MTAGRPEPGQRAEMEVEVTEDLSVNPTGRPDGDVLSTPSLLMLMEQCSSKASLPYLPDGYTTVGYAVDGMRHLAPAALGATVLVRSLIERVDGDWITYSIEVFDGEVKVGVAIHKRAMIARDGGARSAK